MSLVATVTAVSHVGLCRQVNEDFALLGEHCPESSSELSEPLSLSFRLNEPTIIAAIDGLGGHAGGDHASNYLGGYFHANRLAAVDEGQVARILTDANHAVFDLTRRPGFEWMEGAGATVAGIALTATNAVCFNVGDARVYTRDSGYLVQLSIDDSPGGAEGGSDSSMVLQCLGGASTLQQIAPHTDRISLAPGARYLLCTDGLTDLVGIDMLEVAIAESATAAVRGLLRLALEAGGRDNITIIVVDIGECS